MDQPLNTSELESMMRALVGSKVFKGVYPSDHLPDTTNFGKPFCLIINEDCSHRPGTHWNGMYFDEGGGHYFDSYGNPPKKKHWIQFLENNSRSGHWVMQRRQIQSEFSPFCGHHTALFLYLRHSMPSSFSDYQLMLNVNDSNICTKLGNVLHGYHCDI